MNIISKLFGGKEPSNAADKLTAVRSQVTKMEKRLVDLIGNISDQEDKIEDLELAAALADADRSDVRSAKTDLADMQSERAAIEKALDQLEAELPELEQAVSEERHQMQIEAVKDAANKGRKTIDARIAKAVKAKAALEDALADLIDAPEAARMVADGEVEPDCIAHANEELSAKAEHGITLGQLRSRNDAADRAAAARAARLESEGRSIAEATPHPHKWDNESREWVAA